MTGEPEYDRALAVRWAWAEIDTSAIAHNVELIRRRVAPAMVWAVVKADGYGHGSVAVARAALAAGAEGLCVALIAEGVRLRSAGITAPILVLSQQPVDQLADLIANDLTPTAYSGDYLDALVAAGASGVGVHLKLDTGMQRVGSPVDDVPALVDHVRRLAPALRLGGVFTHLACADEPEWPATSEQLGRFDAAIDGLRLTDAGAGTGDVLVHAANSAAALAVPTSHRSLVRAGIAIYGISPGPGVDHLALGLQPALALKARVSYVKRVRAGSSVSYGWRHRFAGDTTVATVPIGYADGVPRRLGTLPDRPGADVLIGGRRCPIVGVVTMDQLMVDVGDASVAIGDEVVLIGRQDGTSIRVEEWAARLGTIGYEVVCAISARVPRRLA
jgi:alanine racemase